jgi:hypothetical protein
MNAIRSLTISLTLLALTAMAARYGDSLSLRTRKGEAYVVRNLRDRFRNHAHRSGLRRLPDAYTHALDCGRRNRTLRRGDSLGS